MDKEKLLPSLRFSGYKDTWERNKLEHYLNVSNEKIPKGFLVKKMSYLYLVILVS